MDFAGINLMLSLKQLAIYNDLQSQVKKFCISKYKSHRNIKMTS